MSGGRVWKVLDPADLEALAERCKGKTGGAESEAHVSWEGWHPDYVELVTARLCDVSHVIQRCGSAVIAVWEGPEIVGLRIARRHPVTGRKVFRGFPGAFAPVDVESAAFPGGAA
ncbi:MAG: hypothetical protein KC656_21200 [Myxococcales bacterium]|nr:hypothetical protein [Myxococcales bacterium]